MVRNDFSFRGAGIVADSKFALLAATRSRRRKGNAKATPCQIRNAIIAPTTLVPKGIQSYWRADFFNEISDEAVELHLKHGSNLPTPFSTMHIYPIDGAVHRVAQGDTAFNFRNANFAQVIVGFSPEASDADRLRSWTVDYWDALHSYSAGGAYINFMMDEGLDRIQATYGDNYNRLVQVKRRYDPNNVFHVNQNIKP